MKRILVISWFFPPINSSEGLVTYKLLKASACQYDVFTQSENTSWSYGNQENKLTGDNIRSFYGRSEDILMWEDDAVSFFAEHRDDYDIVMTRSMPPESHSVGLRIKKLKPSVVWIASFGDPLTDNPYVRMALSRTSPHALSAFAGRARLVQAINPKRILRELIFRHRIRGERKKYLYKDKPVQDGVFREAEYLIFNSTYQRDYMTNGDGELLKRSVVLPHSYDESLYPAAPEKCANGKLKFVYIGHLDNIRTPKLFLKALAELQMDDPELGGKIEVEFYGDMCVEDKAMLIDEELYDFVHVRKPVSYLESLAIMKNADYLLHIDANIAKVLDKNIFFAAKLADYLGAGKPILGITSLHGISTDILKASGSLCLSFSQEEIRNYLYLILHEGYCIRMNPEARRAYDNRVVAADFDRLIGSIEKERKA